MWGQESEGRWGRQAAQPDPHAVLGALCALAKDVLELWYVRLRIRVGGRAAESHTLAFVAVLGANHALAKDALQL